MKLTILREAYDEPRVPLLPTEIRKLSQMGAEIHIETGLGKTLAIADENYLEAGALLETDRHFLLQEAEILLCLQAPAPAELKQLKPGSWLIGLLHPFFAPEPLQTCLEQKLEALPMELLPRISRAQSMDMLTSQASLAGYVAAILAANHLPLIMPLMNTPAGTLSPARVLVIGAGVAGLQAIATARRLGARVEGYDLRPEAREQILSLGARLLELPELKAAQTSDGYVASLNSNALEAQQSALSQALKRFDCIITTAQIFGRPAPQIITRAMLKNMRPGTLIIDQAIESGGNVEGSVAGQESLIEGIRILGWPQLARRVPLHASQMLSANFYYLLQAFWNAETKCFQPERDPELLNGMRACHAGQLTHPRLRERWKEWL
ncbi:NAD(P)(+) transhydrogenase (Re/Si-specific) subunit alpha [bacterium (Candidatus Blackallbacteria) CG17_big_fil_post_rev_8_21_14_2_50_48_46]|uniref:proton-translocating NAD(P)(+) transhydrogenase n=1 Tax=bacterium (Candidatus Blackallbacteria) CG17_big_fil_post_rev_8_21_14_2_50_48_46 TaxID=2014261 RepID=A0A2M7FZ10_9BACT|nr:MAG: NAD(P)(+) transhydrogenase (Re/Si-specific) subunit alpha [bacterium (Candidatus Blackallbacteria) CG18_big_fil_WC_8_21_14_2_50_49_26]PIW14475.1 MAG: NAD(P)(+) transhydrogenase (Re/Si-specific) subunit alpha [bacterium (Candidatus Blackallbacteria) CG17_big_fil_post_rev_8_21_14_2_50_48_46]PIW47161.1 MAG: NAD(P)(+) transhydrogenase (Re/Si-specific) subunit alpha [bacterium (Candidatus Blackallbacteria) CG13_big_fil_rev_8_21_14_2_50_49_14]